LDLPIFVVGGADGWFAGLFVLASLKSKIDLIVYIFFFMIVLNYFLALSDDGI
jgi:hypothetical protein